MRNLLYKCLTLLIAILSIAFLSTVSAHAQQPQYPISQLGNCRDAQECSYYCQIPSNFPSCWSYGKYILHKNVLGDSTQSPEEIARKHGITFPIAELNNCASAEACMEYCNQPANEKACTEFGKKKGLTQNNGSDNPQREQQVLADAKSMLGCNNREACMQYCNNPANQSNCEQFAKKEGFSHHNDNEQNNSQTPQITIEIMKQELGCDSYSSCQDVCNHPENYAKCDTFGKKYHLNSGQQTQNNNQGSQSPSYQGNMPTPPCTDQASCMQWCKDNPDKCQPYQQGSQQNNQYPQPLTPYPSYQPTGYMMHPGMPYNYPTYSPNQQYQQGNYQPPCTDDQSCNQYCQSHPTQCPGFQQNNSGYQTKGYMQPSSYQPTGFQQPQSNYVTPQPPQTQYNNQPSPNIPNSTTDQQQMCSQTPGCSWTGTTCSCSGH